MADGAVRAGFGSMYPLSPRVPSWLRSGCQCVADDGLGLDLDAMQMIRAKEAFRIDLVDLLGAGRTRRETPVLGNHLEAADRRAVARRLGEEGQDGFAGQFGRLLLPRRELGKLLLLRRRRRRLDAIVDRRADLARQVAVEFAGIAPRAGSDLRRQQGRHLAVLVRCPVSAVLPVVRGACALFFAVSL